MTDSVQKRRPKPPKAIPNKKHSLIIQSPFIKNTHTHTHIHPEPIVRVFNSQSPVTQNFASEMEVTLPHGLKLLPELSTQLSISCSSYVPFHSSYLKTPIQALYTGPTSSDKLQVYNSDIGSNQFS